MLMYFILFAVVMLFAGFTSAYIVSNVGQYWVHIEAPRTLWISNALIVASSLPMWLSLRAMKQGQTMTSFIHLALTFALGVAFTVTQLDGWNELQEKGMGWTVDETASGAEAYRWNSIRNLLEGPAEWGVDIPSPKMASLNCPGPANCTPQTMCCSPGHHPRRGAVSNASAGYLFILILIHLFHLASVGLPDRQRNPHSDGQNPPR